MRIGIGLPAAVPGADMAQIGSFAAQAEQAGFEPRRAWTSPRHGPRRGGRASSGPGCHTCLHGLTR